MHKALKTKSFSTRLNKIFLNCLLLGILLIIANTQSCDRYQDLDQSGEALADFTYEIEGKLVRFTNTSSNFANSKWDFGDGSTSTEIHPTHTYQFGGTIKVTLEVDRRLSYDRITKTIQVDGAKETEALISGFASKTFSTLNPNIVFSKRSNITSKYYIEISKDSLFNQLYPATLFNQNPIQSYAIASESLALTGYYTITNLAPSTEYFLRVKEILSAPNIETKIEYSQTVSTFTKPIPDLIINSLVANSDFPITREYSLQASEADPYQDLVYDGYYSMSLNGKKRIYPESESTAPYSASEYLGTSYYFIGMIKSRIDTSIHKTASARISNHDAFYYKQGAPNSGYSGTLYSKTSNGDKHFVELGGKPGKIKITINLVNKNGSYYSLLSDYPKSSVNYIIIEKDAEFYTCTDTPKGYFLIFELTGSGRQYAKLKLGSKPLTFWNDSKTKSEVLEELYFKL